METFVSAVLSELISRSINFIIHKWSKPLPMNMEESLQRALLRAKVIYEEAMGRHITNQAMIEQLCMLRDAMHQGYFALDAFRYQPHYGEDGKYAVDAFRYQPHYGEGGKDPTVMSLSKVRYAKDPYFFTRTADFREQLQEALDRLSSMIVDLNEFVMFLVSYPRLYRQPYSMHILLGNCMFGRQMEVELVIKFLLQTQPHSSQELEVLPIVGPVGVGKTTLVTHVCNDERVRDYFSEIVWLSDSNFTNDELVCWEGCLMKHQNCLFNSNRGKRFLVVIELSRILYEDAWNRFYLASRRSFPSGSKIIVTSLSDQIAMFGTRPSLTLKFLSKEAYWFFFKTLTFGSMNPEKHPRLAQLAMEIARVMHTCTFNAAYVTSYILRENFNTKYWCNILCFLRGYIQKHISDFGVHPSDLLKQNKPLQHRRMAAPFEKFMICHQYHRSSQEEVPEISIQDLLYGSIKRHGKFDVLHWRSQIPPYYSYIITCEIPEPKTAGSKRKRSIQDEFTCC